MYLIQRKSKEFSLNYVVNLLPNKPVKEEFKSVLEAKQNLHFERMKEIIDKLSWQRLAFGLIGLFRNINSLIRLINRDNLPG